MENFDQKVLDEMRVDEDFDEPILHQVLRIAIYDEFHAYEMYSKVIEKFGALPPFSNIVLSEQRHFMSLMTLMQKYEIPIPVNDWASKIIVPDDFVECCERGVVEELKNIKMYDNLILYAGEYVDILDVLYRLQAASYNNHLPAFRRCVANSYNELNLQAQNIQQPQISQEEAMQNAMVQMNKMSEIAAKISSGQLSPTEIMGLLGNTNMSFVVGALIGATGAAVFANMSKQDRDVEDITD